MDREYNGWNYPKLSYPEIYILKDGYKEFFKYNAVSEYIYIYIYIYIYNIYSLYIYY